MPMQMIHLVMARLVDEGKWLPVLDGDEVWFLPAETYRGQYKEVTLTQVAKVLHWDANWRKQLIDFEFEVEAQNE